MTLLGKHLRTPKFVAIILAIYAVCYGTLLLIVSGSGFGFSMVMALIVGMFALATTPFFAISHLNRVTDRGERPPARPIVMALVMAAPATFWFYWGLGSLVPLHYMQVGDFMMLFVFLLIPGILSLWLSVTFAILAVQGRTKDADIE